MEARATTGGADGVDCGRDIRRAAGSEDDRSLGCRNRAGYLGLFVISVCASNLVHYRPTSSHHSLTVPLSLFPSRSLPAPSSPSSLQAMLRSVQSPKSPQDDHLRHLLDQRAARSDMHHRRFPSLTDLSDSPSVYSHPYFSPHPVDRAELEANADAFDFAIPAHYRSLMAHEPRTPGRDRQRLDDPSASTLDLDDDSTDSHPASPLYDDDRSPPYLDDDTEPVPRMSMLGPKMKFHSPAPWETEEDPIQEQDEPDDDARSFISKRGRIRTKGEGFMKGFGIGSSTARGSSATRPSADSSRSSDKDKGSFETTSSHAQPHYSALQ